MPHESLSAFPLVLTIPILWGDQDSFAHVNNIVYLRWCETGRIDYIRRARLWRMFEERRIGPIVASISCEFRKPLTYPDDVDVGTRITRLGNSSFDMEHIVVSRALGAVAAQAASTLVVYDYNSDRSTRMPDEIRAAIQAIEGRPL
jgi:acyl-CoA thioester hydrolase